MWGNDKRRLLSGIVLHLFCILLFFCAAAKLEQLALPMFIHLKQERGGGNGFTVRSDAFADAEAYFIFANGEKREREREERKKQFASSCPSSFFFFPPMSSPGGRDKIALRFLMMYFSFFFFLFCGKKEGGRGKGRQWPKGPKKEKESNGWERFRSRVD